MVARGVDRAYGKGLRVAVMGAAAALALFLVSGCSGLLPFGATPPTLGSSGDAGELIAARYSHSGNSLGNMYWVETAESPEGELIVVEADSPSHSTPATIREYRAPSDLLERIQRIADAAGMKAWDDLPPDSMIPLDAATPAITLTYASDDPEEEFPTMVTFSTWDRLPWGGDEAFAELRDELLACLADENLIREYEETLEE